MADAVIQAAEIVHPLLAAGAGAVAAGAAEHVGAELLKSAQSVLARLTFRRSRHGSPDRDEVIGELRRALTEGRIELGELEEIVALAAPSGAGSDSSVTNVFRGEANTVLQAGDLHVEGGIHFGDQLR